VLSFLWTIAIVGFLILTALNFLGLLAAPTVIVPGIQGISQGDTANPTLDVDGVGWSFLRASLASAGSWQSQGGNPGGYLEIVTSGEVGPDTAGYWSQAFEVSGSEPFAALIQFDVKVELGSATTSAVLYLLISNASDAARPDTRTSVVQTTYTRTGDWERAEAIRTYDRFSRPGTYYLRFLVATTASGPGTATVVGVDNLRLHWTTNEGVIVYLPLPPPYFIIVVSQDVGVVLSYYVFLVTAIAAAGAWYAVRERKEAIIPLRAPLPSIGVRLRNRSAWLTVAQVWLALWFFSYGLILLLIAIGVSPTTPEEPVASNGWSILYELADASVYEEFAFRVLLMGLPMAVGSFVLRWMEINRAMGAWRGPRPGRHLRGSWRYLLGGTVRRTSTRETLLASWALLLFSSLLFGLAHAPGWGSWKILPSTVAGLAFGYLFLRHGVGAAILAHFTQDYILSISYLGIGGYGLLIFEDLLLFGLVFAGAGFFAWYVIYAIGHLRLLVSQFAPRAPVRYLAAAAPTAGPPASPGVPTPAAAWPPSLTGPSTAIPRDPTIIPREYAPTYRPPPYGYPPVRFQCPHCAWVEARYEAGRFTCGRCGKTT